MQPKNVIFSVLLIITILAIVISRVRHEPIRKEAFDRHPQHLTYSKHARCRMSCRHISEAEISQIMDRGIINFSKSDKYDKPCPTFALQGQTDDGENIRVIFAQCNQETKVITCYNLEEKFECQCPGDNSKGSLQQKR